MEMTSIRLTLGEQAVRLAHRARETAEVAEKNGRADPDFIAQLREIGSVTGPSSHVGNHYPLRDVLELIKMVARGDGSAGWLAMIYLTSAVGGHWLGDAGRDEVLADGVRTLVAGVLAPRGRANTVQDGFYLSGQWPFGSGSADADWMGLGAVIDDEPERTGVFFIPRAEIKTLPTWQVVGLRATASNDQVVEGVFVPASRVAYLDGPNLTGEAIANFPIFGLLAAGIGAVAVGIAEAAVGEVVELSGAKTPTGSNRRLVDRAAAQEAVARAHAGLESAWHYLDRAVAVTEIANRSDKVRLRLAATNAMETSRHVVDSLYSLAGGSSIYERSPMQRLLRDIHTASQHMMVGQPTWELTGRVLLGLETDPPGL